MSRNLSALQLVCLLAAAIGFASADEPERLIGGDEAVSGEFPYMASLRHGGYHFCGGSIISDTHILTAAHCVADIKDLSIITVVTGNIYILSGGDAHKVEEIFVHPQYKQGVNWYYDVAVIKLRRPIVFNRRQSKVNLPTHDAPRDIKATVTGWGKTDMRTGRSPFELQSLVVSLIDTCTCQTHFNYGIYDDMICALDAANHGTCSGDSGGPMVYKNEVIGIVSGGVPCALGKPDIYTSVWWMRYFIQDAMTR